MNENLIVPQIQGVGPFSTADLQYLPKFDKVATGRKRAVKVRMTTKRGKATKYTGINEIGHHQYTVRVVVKSQGQRREKETIVMGTLEQAIQMQARLRIALEQTPTQAAPSVQLPKTNLDDLSVRWMEVRQATGKGRVKTNERYEDHFRTFINPYFGKLDAAELKPKHVMDWMEWLGQLRKSNGDHYAQQTFQGAWRTFRAFITWAAVYLDLPRNPVQGVKFCAMGLPPTEKASLTQLELDAMLKTTEYESDDVAAMIWMAGTTGMRFGEITALEWADIDFVQNTIRVSKSQVEGVVGKTKTSKARVVPLNAVLKSKLAVLKEQTKGVLLFPSQAGTYRHPSMLQKPLAACAKRAGIDKHVTPHTFRRTVNNLIRMTAGEIVARSLLGHMTEQMTEHYSTVGMDEKQKAVAALAVGLGGAHQEKPAS